MVDHVEPELGVRERGEPDRGLQALRRHPQHLVVGRADGAYALGPLVVIVVDELGLPGHVRQNPPRLGQPTLKIHTLAHGQRP